MLASILVRPKRGGDADYHAKQNQPQALCKNQAKHSGRSCAERHADADFACALRDRVRNDAVNADGGEQQCENRERTEQTCA